MYGDLGMSPVTCQLAVQNVTELEVNQLDSWKVRFLVISIWITSIPHSITQTKLPLATKLDSDQHWIKELTFAVGQFWLSSLQYPGTREGQIGKVIKTWSHNGVERDGVCSWSVMVCVIVVWCDGKWWHTHWTWPCEALSMLWVSPDRVSSGRQSDQQTVLQLESNYKCACLWLEKISLENHHFTFHE